MESNMICITEEQAGKLQALGMVVDISYTVNAALVTELANILSINGTEEKVVRTKTRRKYVKRRKDNKDSFTFLQASHPLDVSPADTFPLAFTVDGVAPSVSQRAKMQLFKHMRETGIRLLSRSACYNILKVTMADVFVAPQKPASLAGVLFTVAHSKGFAPLWGDDGEYATPPYVTNK